MEPKSNEKEPQRDSLGSCGADLQATDGDKAEKSGVTNIVPDFEEDPEEMKRLVRKIDRCLLPFMVRICAEGERSTTTSSYY